MSEIGQKLLDGYNKFSDVVVSWEIEQLSKLIFETINFTFINLDLLLPLSWLIVLYFFKFTRPFVIGSVAIGFLLFLRGL